MAMATGDLSVWTVGAIDLKTDLKNVTVRGDLDRADGRGITRLGKSAQALKKHLTFNTSLMSTISGSAPTRVSGLNLSVLTVDAVDYLARLQSLQFNGAMETAESSGVADVWKFPQIVNKDYTAEAEFTMPNSAASDPGLKLFQDFYATIADLNMILSLTLNGAAITLPMLLAGVEITEQENNLALVKASLEGRSPDSGDFPTAPTLSATLLEKAFNAPGTALAYTFTPHASEWAALTGNVIITGFSFGISQASMVMTDYTFENVGTPVLTTN
jgi:hypothetical protein